MPYSIETARIDGGSVSAGSIGCVALTLNSGTLTLNGDLNALSATIAPGATLVITGSASHVVAGTLTNHGTIRWQGNSIEGGSGGSGTGHIINAPDGIFDIQCDNSISTNITFDNQGSLLKSVGTPLTSPPFIGNFLDCELTSSGTISVAAGALNLGNPRLLSGNVTVESAAALSCYAVMSPAVLEPSARFGGQGDIRLQGDFSGTFVGRARFSYRIGGDLTVASGSTVTIANLGDSGSFYIPGTLTNHGTILWQSGSIEGGSGWSGNGRIINAPDGIFDIQCDNSISTNIAFDNKGSLLKSVGTPLTSPPFIGNFLDCEFTSSGTISVAAGALNLGNPRILSGNVTVESAAALSCYAVMSPAVLEPSARFGGQGDIRLEGDFSGTFAGRARFNYRIGGNLTIASGSTVTIGDLLGGGNFYLTGTLTNHGTILWQGNSIGAGADGSGTGHIINAPDGIFDIQCDNSISSNIAFDNQGLFLKSNGPGATSLDCELSNSGTAEIHSGILLVFRGINQTAGITRLEGGTIYCTIPSSIRISGGELQGSGTINGNVLVTQGTLRPGTGSGSAPLQIYGNLELGIAATLTAEAGSASPADFGRLTVMGNTTLAGNLVFSLSNGFVPITGSRFRVLQSLSVTGSFASSAFPALPAATDYLVCYGGTFAEVVVGVTSFGDWKALHFGNETDPAIIGDNADPDLDGVANLLEYAFGLEPLTASRAGLPVTTLQSAVPGGPLYLTLSFKTPATVTDLSFVPQVSGNLVDWMSGPGRTEIVSDTTTAGLRTVVVRDSVPVSAAARRFIQLQVRTP